MNAKSLLIGGLLPTLLLGLGTVLMKLSMPIPMRWWRWQSPRWCCGSWRRWMGRACSWGHE